MCEDSSSNIVANPTDFDYVDGGNELDDADIECDEDLNVNADNKYRIDGMEDIEMVRFDLLNPQEFSKYHFADNGVGYDFYNTYGLLYILVIHEHVTTKLKRVCKLITPHVDCTLQQEAMSFAQVMGPH
ncbi:hypothetical protein RIF29_04391 [Crotalaria pallida]|uniref:Uncharacterized protein n=1 Tax=Crotalaria pallida TaxID=3830 RepID=A0AAN9PAC7_CROPI